MRRSAFTGLVWLLLFTGSAIEHARAAEDVTGEHVTTVVAVRHAEKATDQGRDPHLTDAGSARAQALTALLSGGTPVGALYSSEFHRTRETLLPLSEQLHLDIETVPASQTNEHLTSEFLIDSHPGQIVVVSGHSNTIPALVEALTGTPTPQLDEAVYDALFLVSIHADGEAHAVRLSYGEPTEPAN